ncbi:MAG: hypothetical protein QW547_02595 [Candidatus Bathyarchaeia archaeon]
MKRISITIPDELAEALDKATKLDPLKPPKSRIVSEALMRYLALKYPSLLGRRPFKGPTVVAVLKIAGPRAPSPTLRRTRVQTPRWIRVEG